MMFDNMKGVGCIHCHMNRFNCDAQYRSSRCSELRRKAGTDYDAKTNIDYILEMNKEDIHDFLIDYFSSLFSIGDSYTFDLTRVKEAFAIGTMSFDDFKEWDEGRVSELVDDFLDWIQSSVYKVENEK